jgi:hypothetical protein
MEWSYLPLGYDGPVQAKITLYINKSIHDYGSSKLMTILDVALNESTQMEGNQNNNTFLWNDKVA